MYVDFAQAKTEVSHLLSKFYLSYTQAMLVQSRYNGDHVSVVLNKFVSSKDITSKASAKIFPYQLNVEAANAERAHFTFSSH